jgi:hypothetical protein
LLTADCSFPVEISTVSPIAMPAVSSANVAMVLFDVVGTSLTVAKIRKRLTVNKKGSLTN